MEKQIIIDTDEIQERRVAIIEDQKLVEYYIERVDAHRHIGNLYKGKVSNIVTGIQAAFIDIGLPKNGFLHVQELDTSAVEGVELEDGNVRPANRDKSSRKITDILKEGQEVIVQVVKEPMGTKGCRLTTNVSLPGRFLVFLPCEEQIAVSRKIFEAEERKRLKALAAEVDLPKGCGLIVRTAAEGCSEKAFINDAKYLIGLWNLIESGIKNSEAPALVHQELDLAQKIIRDSFSEDVAKIVVNCPEGHKHILDFVKKLVPGAAKQVHLYQGDLPIFAKWGVQKDIERALRRKVWLKCGGYLVIDQTEALVAIDVNSGRNVSSSDLEKTVTQTNLEAADEVARQLKLRNVGGLVVIDFIDMRSKKNQQDVLMRLQNALRKDNARSSILPISEFGLVEMTRQRVKESISQSVYNQCPYCKGRGIVKSVLSVCIDLQRALKAYFAVNDRHNLKIEVNPLVMGAIRDNIDIFKDLENRYKATLTISSKEKLHVEDINVSCEKTNKKINLIS